MTVRSIRPCSPAARNGRSAKPVAGTTEGRRRHALAAEDFLAAMEQLASLRAPVDAFFDQVVVNDADSQLRRQQVAFVEYPLRRHGCGRGCLENRRLKLARV